jgi:hypothetical protein
MAKEWILNSAMNRFQFNFKRNVGEYISTLYEIVGVKFYGLGNEGCVFIFYPFPAGIPGES